MSPFDRRRGRPAAPQPRTGSRNDFGATWWAQAWVDALEGRAQLDPNRLPRGRTYARQGRVGSVSIEPGVASAWVRGSGPEPYSTVVGVRCFSPDEWDRLLSAIAGRALHAAALLDGELVPEILDDARTVDVELLPGPGDLLPQCSCPDWADPCKHAAAVCYLVARELDADPFALLLLRGKDRGEVLEGVRQRRSGTTGSVRAATKARAAKPAPVGVLARDAWSGGGSMTPAATLWALAGPPVPRRPGHPTPLAVDPPRDSHLSADALQGLAQDAANRAWHMLRGGTDQAGSSGLSLTVEQDVARRAAPLLGTSEFTRLARSSGIASHNLVEFALAWRMGGAEGIDILTQEWEPDAEMIADGRDALMAVVLRNVKVRVRGNRITAGPVQLRVAANGNWYRFEKVNNRWELKAGPDLDPLNVAEPQDLE